MTSPIHTLVSTWWGRKPPFADNISAHRARLYEAAAAEIHLKQESNLIYDPAADNRFLWACQWLDVANGTRHRIDLAATDSVSYIFNDPPSCRLHAAAADLSPV
jgi:hypothetical protein